jgi:hypothetical protein
MKRRVLGGVGLAGNAVTGQKDARQQEKTWGGWKDVALKDRQQRLREIQQQIATGLEKAELSERQRREYGRTIHDIVKNLRLAALNRLYQFAREYRFYGSYRALTQGIKEKYPKLKIRAGKVLKGMFDRDGTIHLDGGGNLYGRRARLSEFQAHEIAHAIDGYRELSSAREWRQAWEAEIADGGFLGENSSRSPHEGWGDFGSLLLGSEISLEEIGQVMPRALKFWRKRGLI